MQKKKNIRLLIIFLVMLAWTIFFINMDQSSSKITINENKFSVEDTASIEKIIIQKPHDTISLYKTGNLWTVNEKYNIDPSMQKVLFAVLHAVRVKRTVPLKNKPEILKSLEERGINVNITFSDNKQHEFIAGGNGISVSYFTDDFENIYVVNLPGYESYVTGIFEVSENDWRDRLLYQTSWLGMKSIELNYGDPSLGGVAITATDSFYKVEGVSTIDSTLLMSFIEENSFFYVDQYINKGQFREYDSLAQTKPFATFSVNALGFIKPLTIDYFESLPNEGAMLGIIDNHQFALFQVERMSGLFKERKYFENRR